MTLHEAIEHFPEQLRFSAKVENAKNLSPHTKFVVCGMGGSNHATDILRIWRPKTEVVAHRDYGLPPLDDIKERLIICCSYSGNTEEVMQSFDDALAQGLSVAVITKGGELLTRAKKEKVPYIILPEVGIQPRSATGYMFVSLLQLMGDDAELAEVRLLADTIGEEKNETLATTIAEHLKGFVPIIYASHRNWALANNWKIKFNENVKIPAYWGMVPELNHNEMNGFEENTRTEEVRKTFRFVFLRDDEDDPRNQKRLDVLRDMYHDRGREVVDVSLSGATRLEKLFSSLLLAELVTLDLAQAYGVAPEPVAMVEEFKKRISD